MERGPVRRCGCNHHCDCSHLRSRLLSFPASFATVANCPPVRVCRPRAVAELRRWARIELEGRTGGWAREPATRLRFVPRAR